MDGVFDALMRAIGGFYVFAAVIGLRAAATTSVLDQALSALGAANKEETKAEKERNAFLAATLVVIGVGGGLLVMLIDVAAWVFFLAALLNAFYLHWLAPRRFDPHDPPEEPGRSQTRNAYWIYVAATALVLAGWWSGRLTPLAQAGAPVLLVGFGIGVALIAYAIRLRLQSRLTAPSRDFSHFETDDETPAYTPAVSAWENEDLEIIMRPSWHMGPFCDAQTGKQIDAYVGVAYSMEEDAAVYAWLNRYWEIADPDDPSRRNFLPGADIAAFEAQGRAIYEALAVKWAPRKLFYRPTPDACLTQYDAEVVKVMADYQCPALWVTFEGDTLPVSAHDFGLSWNLAREIFAWENDFETRFDYDDPGASRPDDAAFTALHDEQGRKLAVRLARELAATGRAHVKVQAFRTGVGPYDVTAQDALEARV